jgi:ABC-type multidrug transport system fused ATPase/permease subunit
MDLVGLRSLFGIVSQETVLFNDSVFNNIAYGAGVPSTERVMEAARAANALEFIEKMPEGFDTVIGERGVMLSGGQRQRLSIARAILTNPKILILDEATSALDTESERLVQSAINNLMENRTALVVAHRLSTIRHADLILVLEGGKIVERGTHEELLDLNRRYKYFYDIQFAASSPNSVSN